MFQFLFSRGLHVPQKLVALVLMFLLDDDALILARDLIERHTAANLKGELVPIDPKYRDQHS